MDYTLALTSCGRFDLLDATLASFHRHADIPPSKVIVTEDSGDSAVGGVVCHYYPDADVIVNAPPAGQIKSIDTLYARIKTDLVFHCEDDWEFLRSGFVAESIALLEAIPQASMNALRARSEINPLVRNAAKRSVAGIDYFMHDPSLHPEYFGYAFNPGLRRLADYRAVGPFEALGHEREASLAFKKRGQHMVSLEQPAVRHIGDGRHVQEDSNPRPTGTISRWRRSVEKRISRFQRWRRGE
ncbi:MAG: glycosyltransferase family 2 protein [Pseudomonadota bacterium]